MSGYSGCRFEAVQPIHGCGEFAVSGVWQYPNDFIGHRIELFGFLLAEASEYIAGHFAAVAGVADTDAQSLKLVGAQVSDGIPQAVVSAMSAAFFKFGGAGRDIEFVVSDENLLWFYLEKISQSFDG